ncbi:MAG: hydroxyquinol 1,2-dioxygenase [Planctomycetes bacterium]|jgi:hydroxyquinol 1,2-dioxygenase|nr:hydroxyquinol 1,2-dioxygenase [Planctomycetota bacterium]
MSNSHDKGLENRYDSLELITQEVLERYAQTPDPRLRELMLSLIKHIHSFAKEVKLTADEWNFTMSFLEQTGKWCSPGRNEFMIFSDALGLSMLTVTQDYPRPAHATEPTLVGPFLLEDAPQFPMGADISAGATGTPMHAQGQILTMDGQPVANAVIDVWHSDDRGLYDVQDGLEEKGAWARAVLTTGGDGRFSFWSVLPVDYPVPQDGTAIQMLKATTGRSWRPAHLHFRIRAAGQRPLITHIFDRTSKNLDGDAVFGVRPSLIADFKHQASGIAPDGKDMMRDFYTLDYNFVMTDAIQ